MMRGTLFTSQTLKRLVLECIGDHVGRFGFSGRSGGFKKKMNEGVALLGVPISLRGTWINAPIYLSIRFAPVENVVNKYREDLSDISKRNSRTIAGDLGNLKGTGFESNAAESEREVAGICEKFRLDFETFCLPFFEKYTVMRNAYEALSKIDESESAWKMNPLRVERAKRVIVMAILLGMDSNVEDIFKAQYNFIMRFSGREAEDFLHFCRELSEDRDDVLRLGSKLEPSDRG